MLTQEDIDALKDGNLLLAQSYKEEKTLLTIFLSNCPEPYHRIIVDHLILDNEGDEVPDCAVLKIENLQQDEIWQSAISLLELGDELTFRWCRGTYTGEEMLRHDLVGDGVELEIKSDKKRLVFLLCLHISKKRAHNRMFKFKETL